MHICGNYRVAKIVGVQVPLAAEIKPGLRVLVYKERRKRTDVAQAGVLERSPLPRAPGFQPQGMRGRAESHQIHHHQFAVSVPAVGQKTDFRCPAMREQRRVF